MIFELHIEGINLRNRTVGITKLELIKGDITKQDTEAIVNASNKQMPSNMRVRTEGKINVQLLVYI